MEITLNELKTFIGKFNKHSVLCGTFDPFDQIEIGNGSICMTNTNPPHKPHGEHSYCATMVIDNITSVSINSVEYPIVNIKNIPCMCVRVVVRGSGDTVQILGCCLQ